MHSRRIVEFYEAFKRGDAQAMQAAYAPHARFSSPLFTLQGAQDIGAMWAMLCQAVERRRLADWRLEVTEVAATAKRGRAQWEPQYRLSGTGRSVRSAVAAEFVFDKEGRIVLHRERFSFWRWARQAFGWRGTLLGWTPLARLWMRAWGRRELAMHRRPFETTVQLPYAHGIGRQPMAAAVASLLPAVATPRP